MVGKLFQQPLKSEPQPKTQRDDTWNYDVPGETPRKMSKFAQLMYIPLGMILILLFLLVLFPVLTKVDLRSQYFLNQKLVMSQNVTQDVCSFEIVESIPTGLKFNSTVKHTSTFQAWKKLIQMAQHKIEIGSFYWTLKKWDEYPVESKEGDEIFNDLLDAGLNRKISIKIAQSKPTGNLARNDTEILAQKNAAQVKSLDFDALIGNGVLHTKFWIVDRKHLYIGSANMDWRALTEVKELGIVMYNCSNVAEDLAKIFEVYWMAGNTTALPDKWPDSLSTIYNSKNPFNLTLNGQRSAVYITSSPPQLSPRGRNDDLDGLLSIIRSAKKFIHISVMDYLPLVLYSKNLEYWGVIDNELRKAVVDRGVEVRLLTSLWPSTRNMEMNFLRSLLALNSFKKGAVLEVRLFRVPPTESKIPYTRVNHAKYMVTDNGAFIGTSNWSGDYFLTTAGVSLISPPINRTRNVIQEQLKDIFLRDWNSDYAKPLSYQPKRVYDYI